MPKELRELTNMDGRLLLWALQKEGHYPVTKDCESMIISNIYVNDNVYDKSVGFEVSIHDKQTNLLKKRDMIEVTLRTFSSDGKWLYSEIFIYPEKKFIPQHLMIDWMIHVGLYDRLVFPIDL